MFNLLVAYSGWTPSRDTVDRTRVLEYSADELEAGLLTGPNKTPDTDVVIEFAVFLACESSTDRSRTSAHDRRNNGKSNEAQADLHVLTYEARTA
jgi:hypothetical protein